MNVALADWDGAVGEMQDGFREILGPDADRLDDLLRRLSRGLAPGSAAADPAEPVGAPRPGPRDGSDD